MLVNINICVIIRRYIAHYINIVYNLYFVGSFKAAAGGTILKRYSETEKKCFELLMKDPLAACVPSFHGVSERDGESYIQLDDLLNNFDEPCVMDCKMGVRWVSENCVAVYILLTCK